MDKMVAQNTLRKRGVNKAIRSIKGSCLYRQQLHIFIILKKEKDEIEMERETEVIFSKALLYIVF